MADDGPAIDVRLSDGPVAYAAPQASPPTAGGECVFIGRSRAETHPVHGRLRRLCYQAYEPMAERVLRDLAMSAVARYGCRLVRLHHALGEVPVGEASVMVVAACPHRREAFEACRYLIDALKQEAPIWKCETWADGATWATGTPVCSTHRPDRDAAAPDVVPRPPAGARDR